MSAQPAGPGPLGKLNGVGGQHHDTKCCCCPSQSARPQTGQGLRAVSPDPAISCVQGGNGLQRKFIREFSTSPKPICSEKALRNYQEYSLVWPCRGPRSAQGLLGSASRASTGRSGTAAARC